jgi:hydrogenase-4 membrane subunit HyfE
MTITFSLLLAFHFSYHLIASVMVVYSLYHSNTVHKRAWWKLVLAAIWVVISVYLAVEVFSDGHHC